MSKDKKIKMTLGETILGILATAPGEGKFRERELEVSIDKASKEFPELKGLLRTIGTDGSTPSDGEIVLGSILSFLAMGRRLCDVGDFQHDAMPASAAKEALDELEQRYGAEGIDYINRVSRVVWREYKE